MENIYLNIKRKRNEKGWSQEYLAKKVGYADKTMVSKIEKGKIDLPLSQVEAFATALGVKPGELLGDVEQTESVPLTRHEKSVLIAYRRNVDMQDAVDRLLGIEKKELSSGSQSA